VEIEREGCCSAWLAAHFVEQPAGTTKNSEEGFNSATTPAAMGEQRRGTDLGLLLRSREKIWAQGGRVLAVERRGTGGVSMEQGPAPWLPAAESREKRGKKNGAGRGAELEEGADMDSSLDTRVGQGTSARPPWLGKEFREALEGRDAMDRSSTAMGGPCAQA
jgi:hypothetical protein